MYVRRDVHFSINKRVPFEVPAPRRVMFIYYLCFSFYSSFFLAFGRPGTATRRLAPAAAAKDGIGTRVPSFLNT
jgi:hypothetical protein